MKLLKQIFCKHKARISFYPTECFLEKDSKEFKMDTIRITICINCGVIEIVNYGK